MPLVLGIDAAWTATQPSGVALLRAPSSGHRTSRTDGRWECLAVAPDYASFLSGRVDWSARPVAGPPEPAALHARCIALAGGPPDVIAIDMPLATRVITGRRAADNAISSAYGGRGLGVHTPNPDRPGPIADAMRLGFGRLGYRVATASTPASTPRVLIESFPHAAAIELLRADYRVPYKLSRARQYWPDAPAATRRRKLVARWRALHAALSSTIDVPALWLPAAGPLASLKRHEDALDALICAWIGIEYLAGHLRAYGDATSAVWAH